MDEDHGHDSDSSDSLPDPRSFLESLVPPVTCIQQRHDSELSKITLESNAEKFEQAYDDFRQLVEVCDPKVWSQYENRHELFRNLARNGRVNALKILLQPERQANVNHQDKDGQTALHLAALRSQYQTVKFLIENDADVHLRSNPSKGGETALHCSLKWRKKGKTADTKKVVVLLLERNADPNRKAKGEGQNAGYTPLHYAANKGHSQVVPILLEKGAESSVRCRTGEFPLHRAAYMGHDEVITELFKHDPTLKIDEADRAGNTPLYFAIHNYEEVENKSSLSGDYPKTVRVLLERGADVRFKVRGSSMADWAESVGAGSEIAKIIQHKTRKDHFHSFVDSESDVRRRLEPPSSNMEKAACSRTNASVFVFPTRSDVKRDGTSAQLSITELVYSDGIRKELSRIEAPKDPEFTWYHLPANNLDWVEHLQSRLWLNKKGDGARINPYVFRSYLETLRRRSSPGYNALATQFRHERLFGESKHVDSIFISMPLLSIEARHDLKEYKDRTSKAPSVASEKVVFEPKPLANDYATLAHAYPKVPLRQTLDQYYYNHLSDTTARDSSQVLLRAFSDNNIVVQGPNGHVLNKVMDYLREQWWPPEPNKEGHAIHRTNDNGNVIMTDQLWLWVIGEDTIISCFPPNLRESSRNLLSFVGDLNQALVLPGFPARDFAVCILTWSLTFATFQEQNYLAAFHRMIDETADLQTKHFKAFIEESREADRAKDPKEDHKSNRNRQAELENALDNLGSIEQEIKNLGEVDDVIDELRMIDSVVHEQREVIEAFRDLAIDEKGTFEVVQHQQKQKLLYETVRFEHDEVLKMLGQARRTMDAIRQLLDLKQKQATMIESRSARQQAADTARQGDTVLVFTVVTIIFLPASFMAAFFAIPDIKVPGIEWGIGFAAGIIILMTITIASPLVFLAFNVGNVRSWFEVRKSKSSSEDKTRSRKGIDLETGRSK
ncbi:MAG: hypothetical protein M1820_007381 [Bogoriella megaspora]|nr:MAG: hypothetical protein M1820_007381 [Bogoriella megaspora]